VRNQQFKSFLYVVKIRCNPAVKPCDWFWSCESV